MGTLRRPSPGIVLFDGVCNACNGFVRFLLERDPDASLFFVASQSEAGRELMRRYQISEEAVQQTVYLITEEGIFSQSTATLKIASRLRLPWRLASAFRIVPRFLRDRAYRFVSAHRYQWFGKLSECRIPTPQERARFIQTREELERFPILHA